ncbi:hypothetical protein BYT27DRAFT_6532691 [Phlegmacium glaucopus]|nr:hypothetical protein BYT27DRAFT_6532691 [Phlegmacium glaucopus]
MGYWTVDTHQIHIGLHISHDASAGGFHIYIDIIDGRVPCSPLSTSRGSEFTTVELTWSRLLLCLMFIHNPAYRQPSLAIPTYQGHEYVSEMATYG